MEGGDQTALLRACVVSSDIPSTAAPARAGCVVPALAVLIAVGVLAVAFVGSTCVRGGRGTTFEADLAQFATDDPVFVSGRGFYLVRLSSGEVVALTEQEARREDRLNGCVIRYRETLQVSGHTGAFRSDCTGTVYDLKGLPLDGTAPPMKRHPVTVSGKTVKVDTSRCLDGATRQTVACRA
jgi:hypothetical protein